MLPAGVVDCNVSKAFKAFLSRPRVPCLLNEALHGEGFIGPRSFERLGTGCEPPPPVVIQIRVFVKTLMGKNWMHEANQLLREVKRNLRAIRFRFPEDVVDDLL